MNLYLGIDHVQVAAPPGCEAVARKFYVDVLGMAELTKPPALQSRGGIWLQCGMHQLHIGVQKDFSPAIKAHPAIRVMDMAALRSRLKQHNIEVIADDAIIGLDRFYIHDPFGNRLEFVEVQLLPAP
ncbi:MAG: VOC family protein [Terriglobales bacterium]|jgi:catechol 2,3-dioxygenase-like lactoylglutathione lyase family enzyme